MKPALFAISPAMPYHHFDDVTFARITDHKILAPMIADSAFIDFRCH